MNSVCGACISQGRSRLLRGPTLRQCLSKQTCFTLLTLALERFPAQSQGPCLGDCLGTQGNLRLDHPLEPHFFPYNTAYFEKKRGFSWAPSICSSQVAPAPCRACAWKCHTSRRACTRVRARVCVRQGVSTDLRPSRGSWAQGYRPVLKVGRISVGPRHPSALTQLFRKTSLARINTVINYGGSPNKRGRAREGRDSPRRASELADRTAEESVEWGAAWA